MEVSEKQTHSIELLNCLPLVIWSYFDSQSVNAGEDATFTCDGLGSHLYWFINGVNTENMTTEEITERGIQISGYYNSNPPYSGFCDSQHSVLTMAGNCINNNSVIYCVILGSYPPPDGGNTTSNTVTLTVTGA